MADQLAVVKYENDLRHFLVAQKNRIAAVLEQSVDFARFTNVTMGLLRRVPDLAECSLESVFESVMKCAELGLEPGGPLGHAYVLPYKKVATLVVGYRGWVHLMYQSGAVLDADASVVYEQDIKNGFRITRTSNGPIVHHPFIFGAVGADKERGARVGAYATIRFTNGGKHIEPMTADQIVAVKNSSPSSKSSYSPWNGPFEDEMWRKTPLKRGAKWAPTGRRYDLMAKAMDYDSEHDTVDARPVVPATTAPQLAPVININTTVPEKPSEAAAPVPRQTPPASATGQAEMPLAPAPAAPQAELTPEQRESNEFAAMMKELYACNSGLEVDKFVEKYTGWQGSQRPEMARRIKERRKEVGATEKK